MLLQLNPPIPVLTRKGPALAIILIDDGSEHDLKWVCIEDSTGECWTVPNPQIRGQRNVTQGRTYISPFYDPDDVAFHGDEEDEDSDEETDDEERISGCQELCQQAIENVEKTLNFLREISQ
jgi:hypothetical protein